jgi:hypothetical protein
METVTTTVEPFSSSQLGQVHFFSSSRVSWTYVAKRLRCPCRHRKANTARITATQIKIFVKSLTVFLHALGAQPTASHPFHRLVPTRRQPGGEGGIRTPVPLTRKAVFKTAAIDHSATSPAGLAGREGVEPPTNGFGDRYSTN